MLRVFIVIAILLGSLLLRFHNYATYPQRGATSDEYTYSFLGISLLQEHRPISWSSFPAYPSREHIVIRKITFPIVSPYFDHPPLYGILVGMWALLNNEDTFEKINLETIRIVPIVLSTISALLVFLIGRTLYGYKPGLWALLIYSTTTLFIINGRVSVSENLLSVWFLWAIYLFILYKKTLTPKRAAILGIIAGLAFLTKIAGITVCFSLLILLIMEKPPRKVFLTFIGTFVCLAGVLLVYAAYYDWDLFWAVQQAQSARETGPQTFRFLLATPIIINKVYYDGWYFAGILSILLMAKDWIKHRFVLIPALIYFLFLVVSLTREGLSGWYQIPLFPFMALATGYVLRQAHEKGNFLFVVFTIIIGMYFIEYGWDKPLGLTPLRFRMITIMLLGPLFLAFLFSKKQWMSRLTGWYFYFFIAGNALLTYYYVHPG